MPVAGYLNGLDLKKIFIRKIRNMKRLHHILMAAIVALGFALHGGAASAANLGTLVAGDYSVDFDNALGTIVSPQIEGSLPSNTMVTFTYNFGAALLPGSSITALLQNDSGKTVFDTNEGYTANNPLLFVSAQFSGDNTAATVILKNLSADPAGAFSLVFGFLGENSAVTSVAYHVSAVPLPAALPLFGVGLGALAGFGIRRKRKELAAA